jgi:hypothetical protein
MSIAYALFGIPRTFDEFIDKVKRKGLPQVDVRLGKYDSEGAYLWDTHCVVGVQAGSTQLALREFVHVRMGDLQATRIGLAETERDSLQEAIAIAEKVQGLGLEATVVGQPIGQAKQDVVEYERIIADLKSA